MINSHTQLIARLETQIGQLAVTLGKREEGKLPNQPEVNPRMQNYQGPQQGAQINQLNAIHILRSGR